MTDKFLSPGYDNVINEVISMIIVSPGPLPSSPFLPSSPSLSLSFRRQDPFWSLLSKDQIFWMKPPSTFHHATHRRRYDTYRMFWKHCLIFPILLQPITRLRSAARDPQSSQQCTVTPIDWQFNERPIASQSSLKIHGKKHNFSWSKCYKNRAFLMNNIILYNISPVY